MNVYKEMFCDAHTVNIISVNSASVTLKQTGYLVYVNENVYSVLFNEV